MNRSITINEECIITCDTLEYKALAESIGLKIISNFYLCHKLTPFVSIFAKSK